MTILTRQAHSSLIALSSVAFTLLPGCGSEDVKAEEPAMSGDDEPEPDADMPDDDAPVGDDDTAADDDDTAMPVDTSDGMVMADFEAWNGTTALPEWSFQYGPPEMPYTAGPFELSDETGEYTLEMVEGHESQYAVRFANSEASGWGGGVGFWMGETDVTGYSGVAFWVKGTTPTGTMEISLGRPETECADGEPCSRSMVKFDTPADWTQVSFEWSEFTAGENVDGDTFTLPAANINAVGFNAHMVYAQAASGEWLPEPGAFDVTIDDITFY